MTHLYIELNGITEEVSSSVISKLYELASSGTLDGTSNLKGRLHSTTARDIHVAYLNEQFLDLYISVDTLYISFVDPEVERVLINQWGDGSNITAELINSHNNTGSIFKSNTTITSFDELDRFASITTISNQAFEGASNLTSIGLSNIQYIGWNAFKGADITGSISMPNIKVIGSVSESGAGNRGQAFAGNTHITSVSCGSYLTHLFDYSFTNCTSLQTVTGLDNLQTIGPNVFSGCSALTSVTGLSNITSIPAGMFSSCTSLTNVDIDWTKTTSVGQETFRNCSNLVISTLSLPLLTTIGLYSFANTKIQSISNLGSITSIPNNCFENCSELTSVTLPNTITSLGVYSFWNDSSLLSINIPTSCTTLGAGVFKGCTSLSGLFDLSNVTSIGQECFLECSNVIISNFPKISTYQQNTFRKIGNTSIVIPKEVTSIGNSCFYQCESLLTLSFEQNSLLTSIGSTAFAKCLYLQSIILPEGITTIGQQAFDLCNRALTVDIPSTVSSIGLSAFSSVGNIDNYSNATTVIFRGSTPPTCSSTGTALFGRGNTTLKATLTIYVPDAVVNTYKSLTYLSSYSDRIFGISQMPNS